MKSTLTMMVLAAAAAMMTTMPAPAAEPAAAPAPRPMTVAEAIREARCAPPPKPEGSCFLTEIHRRDGTFEPGEWKKNLTTDTASGFTNRRDWQAKAMAAGASQAFATIAGNATATSATTLTNSGAAFPTAGQGLAGQWVVAFRNTSGTGSTVMGKIQSNTATVLTVDQWWDPTSTTGAAGTTPNATGGYCIVPGQAPAEMLCITADATAPTSADTSLAAELTTNGFARGVATYGHTAAASTYTMVRLWTCSGGTTTINNEAVAGGANSTSSGVMPFKSAVPAPPTLTNGDTITITCTVTI